MNKILSTLFLILSVLMSANLWAQEPYIVLDSGDKLTMTYYYDANKSSHTNGYVVDFENRMSDNVYTNNRDYVEEIYIDSTFVNYPLTTANALFSNFTALTAIYGLGNLNTSNVEDMYAMFAVCTKLTSLDVSGLNTANVKYMGSMFEECTSLTTLDLSNFNTANVTKMSYMFYHCSSLTTIYVSNLWSTANVTSTNGATLFTACNNLVGGAGTTYDEEHQNVDYAHIDGGPDNPGYLTSSGETPNVVAPEAYAVLSGDNTTLTFYYDDQKVARNGMDIGPFAYLEHGFGESQRPWHDVRESITDVVFDSSMANDTTLISTGWWFYGCTNLKRTSGWQYLPTANIVDMWGMFENCSSLSSNPVEGGPDFSAFNTASLKRTCYLFHGCTSMTSIDLSTFNTANVTETEGMFKDCAALTTIYVGSGWTMTNVSGNWEDDMFSGSTSLVGGAGTTYDASNIGVSYAHIDGGPDNPGYLTSNGDTPYVVASEAYAVLSDDDVVLSQSVTGITYGKKLTFYYDNQKSARNGMSVDFTDSMLREWNSSSSMITSVVFDSSFANDTTLTSTAWWFYNLGNLTTVTGIENLNTNHVTNMYSMFSDCSKLTSLDVTGFNTSNVTDMGYMFVGCSGLTTLDVRGFNTSNVTNMRNMFDSCSGLTSLDVSNFNTANVTNMYGMFMNCSGLTTLDLSSFNTAKVEVMENMFCQNAALATISVDGMKWSTAAVASSTSMFYMCPNLVGGKGTTYDSNHVDASYAHIDGGMANPGYFTAKGGLADPLLARLYDNLALTTTDGNADGGNNDLSGSIDAAQTSLVRAMWNLQELPTDESYCVWMDAGIPALNTNTWSNSTQTDAMRGLYARLYHGIILANNYLANQHDGDMGKQAEARFLRALQYYYLMDHFGNVPLLTDTIDRQPLPVWEATPSDIELLTREEMFSYIENELQESLNSLPATNSYGRATATAARLLLARLYLNSEVYTGTARWQEARSYAESVINGGTFQLAPIYRNLFMGDNDSNGAQQEIILPAIYDGNTRTDYGGTTFLVASSFTNGEGDNGTTQVWAGNVSKPDFVNKFFTQTADIPYASPEQTASAAGDDRALFYGINHSYELRNGDSFSDGFPYQKFTNVRSNGTSPVSSKFADTDFPLMRLGEAYLIAAEADARLNGSATSMQGTQYINMLRNRANATTSTAGYSLSDICDEWSREMGYEAVRRTTLIRFGRFGGQTDYSWAWKGGSYDGTAFDAGMNTYPIPAVEVGSTPEPYVVLTDSNTVMTFYYDGQKATRVGIDINNSNLGDSPSPYGTATSAVFDASFANYYPTSTAYWFQNCSALTSISGVENLKTDNVTNMSEMFSDCSGLTALDVSGFKTDNVTDMGAMFSGCSGLTSLDVSGFKTDNVVGMYGMFSECTGLTSLDLRSFNTASATYMGSMFSGCNSLTSLDVSNFNTANVTDMSWMFSGCSGLTSLNVSNFNTANVTDMSWMFSGCSGLTSLEVSNFKTANVTVMSNMFEDCSSLTSLDLSSFNTSNVTYMRTMFFGCSNLISLNVSNFRTDNVRDMIGMFALCSSLTSLDVSGFKTDKVKDMTLMFASCGGLTSLDLSGFKTDNVTSTEEMFDGCSGLTSLDLGGFKTDSVTYMNNMFNDCTNLTTIYVGSEWSTASVRDSSSVFNNCTSLVGGQGTVYDANHVDVSYAHIDGGPDNPGYFTRSGDAPYVAPEAYAVLSGDSITLTFYYDKKKESRGGRSFLSGTEVYWPNYVTGVTKVSFDESFADFSPTSTSSWFAGFNSLTSVEGMEYLNTEHVTSMISMFQYCENLTSLDLSRLQTGHVETMTNMFYGCKRLANLNLSGFSTVNVTSLASMFYGCQSLTTIDLSSFNTSNVTRMEEMFQDCAGLTTLDLTNFNTENVENMTLMFAGCTNLATIYAGSGWSVAKAADSRQMFDNCTSLVGGQGTVYDAEYTDKTYAHIDGGTSNPGYLTLKLAMGDANGDGNINIADAVSTVTNILGQPTEAAFYMYAADMNTDQVIDIFDVTLIVNAAFDAASPAPAMTRGSADNIMMEHISMTADADYIYLGIDQPERFTATQFDVTLPEGMELVDARLVSATTDHQLSFVKRGNNEYRVIGLSMSNTTFRSMNGQLIKLEVSGSAVDSDVKMSNVLFVTPTATVMTSIDKCLNTAKAADDSLYDLKGQRLSNQQLGKGIYIMNHKKVIIK